MTPSAILLVVVALLSANCGPATPGPRSGEPACSVHTLSHAHPGTRDHHRRADLSQKGRISSWSQADS